MNLYFAPMEGLTGYVYRNAHRACFGGVDKYFTPFLSPNQNHRFTAKEEKDVRPEHNEGISLVPQILTNRAEDFIWAAGEMKARGYREVNLNLGCPSGTVVSKYKGAGFLARQEALNRFLDQIFQEVDLEISVKTRIGIAAPEEFPELPTVDQQNSLTMEQSALRSMIAQTLFAVSDNESRPIHTGSLFEVDQSGLTVVSVDGYRLALRREAVEKIEGAEAFSFVVPGSALGEVEKICSGEGSVTVNQGARHILFQTGDTVLVCRRLEGEFLAYRNAIPRNNPIHVECDARTLLASIDRVSLIISEKLKSPLRCVFGDGLVSITTKTGIGDAADQCPITGNGQELEIGFNNKYLMDALKAAPADRLRLEFSSGVAPCVILPAEGEEKFIYMVLPVRLKAN